MYLTQRNNIAYCCHLFYSILLRFSFSLSLFVISIRFFSILIFCVFCLACYCSHRLSFSPLIDYALSHNIYRTRHTFILTSSHFINDIVIIFFLLFVFFPKREECVYLWVCQVFPRTGSQAATFCIDSIVIIVIVASCTCALALPYQFDTTTIFCRSLLPQLLLLTYARLPLFSPSNRPSARAFFSVVFFFTRSH